MHFLIASIKLRQANLLACSEGPLSNLSHFLTTTSEGKEQHRFKAQRLISETGKEHLLGPMALSTKKKVQYLIRLFGY